MKKSKTKFKRTSLGPIPEDWDVLEVREFADVIGGGTPSTKDKGHFNGDIPWITPRDLSGYNNRFIANGERSITKRGLESSNAKLLPAGSVLLTTRAPVGYLAIAENELSTNQGFHSLVPKKSTDNLFIYYLLKNNVNHLINHASGSTFLELNGKTLKSLEWAIPIYKEQLRIAEILSSLDDKIELNRKMNKTLESIAQAIFKEWFVDFRFPGYEKVKMVDSEMGRLPEGWVVKRLENCIKITQGFSFKGKDFVEEGNILVRMGNFTENGFLSFDENNTKYCIVDCDEKFILKPRDLVLCLSDVTQKGLFLGNPGFIPNDGKAYLLNQRVAKIEGIGIEKMFLYYVFRDVLFKRWVVDSANSTTVLNTSSKAINDFEFVLPDQKIINVFVKLARDIQLKIEQNLAEIKNLSQLRDSLLPRLMSGRVKV